MWTLIAPQARLDFLFGISSSLISYRSHVHPIYFYLWGGETNSAFLTCWLPDTSDSGTDMTWRESENMMQLSRTWTSCCKKTFAAECQQRGWRIACCSHLAVVAAEFFPVFLSGGRVLTSGSSDAHALSSDMASVCLIPLDVREVLPLGEGQEASARGCRLRRGTFVGEKILDRLGRSENVFLAWLEGSISDGTFASSRRCFECVQKNTHRDHG